MRALLEAAVGLENRAGVNPVRRVLGVCASGSIDEKIAIDRKDGIKMTRKFRKMISLIVAMAVLLSATMVPSVAFGDSVSIRTSPERTIADAVLAGFGDYQYLGSTELKNLNGESEAVCFRYAPDAYVIVNHNDLSVPEYSPSNPSPFDAEGATEFVYNGPLGYYYENASHQVCDVEHCVPVDVERLGETYHREISTTTERAARLNSAKVVPNATRASTYRATKHKPVTWKASYSSSLRASAIFLRYMYDYHSSLYLPSGWRTDGRVQEYLKNQGQYVADTELMVASELLNGGSLMGEYYSGLKDFLLDQNISSELVYVRFTNSEWTKIFESYLNDRPVIVHTTNYNYATFGYSNRFLVAYGYYYQDSSGGSLEINDGNGRNSIYISSDLEYYDGLIRFK